MNKWSFLCKWWGGNCEWSVFCANGGTNLIKCEWVWQEKLRWMNPRWKNSRWVPSSSWVRMNEWSFLCKWWGGKCEWSFFCANGGTNLSKCEWVWQEKLRWLNPRWQNSRWLPSSSWVQMNEFESDWISLSQSHSGERECFGVNLREENKVSESKMTEYKKAAIIKLSQNEWVKFFCANVGN